MEASICLNRKQMKNHDLVFHIQVISGLNLFRIGQDFFSEKLNYVTIDGIIGHSVLLFLFF